MIIDLSKKHAFYTFLPYNKSAVIFPQRSDLTAQESLVEQYSIRLD